MPPPKQIPLRLHMLIYSLRLIKRLPELIDPIAHGPQLKQEYPVHGVLALPPQQLVLSYDILVLLKELSNVLILVTLDDHVCDAARMILLTLMHRIMPLLILHLPNTLLLRRIKLLKQIERRTAPRLSLNLQQGELPGTLFSGCILTMLRLITLYPAEHLLKFLPLLQRLVRTIKQLAHALDEPLFDGVDHGLRHLSLPLGGGSR